MGYDTIHETKISDIAEILKDGASAIKSTFSGPDSVAKYSSLTKATKGLIMEFPVLVSKANHIESAGIVAKAYEAKFVTLLQMAFSALNVTHSKDAFEYIRQFHTNLDSNFSVDEFIEIMDSFAAKNESTIGTEAYNAYKAISEDMKNLSYYFGDDINESSLNSFKVMKNYGSVKVVKEYGDDPLDRSIDGITKSNDSLHRNNIPSNDKDSLGQDKFEYQKKHDRETMGYQQTRDKKRNNMDGKKLGYQMAHDKKKDDFDREKFDYQKSADAQDIELKMKRDQRDDENLAMARLKDREDFLKNNLLSSDVKKANELTPTMMVIRFNQIDGGTPIQSSVIIGVKAKLYEVEPIDVINKLITKHVDNNVLLKLVKVSTREISFVKDFLLAIDDAKLNALSKSKRGSTNKMFKVLERRALGGKIRKNLKQKDYAKAISSLVISQEEAEELLKNNIDVSNPRIIRPIMEKLNLISFAIIDESSESVKFLFDTGDDSYETIPLSKLEREQKDGMSKKVINLMAKMNR